MTLLMYWDRIPSKYLFLGPSVTQLLKQGNPDVIRVIHVASQKANHFDSASTANLNSTQCVAENLGFNIDSFVEVLCFQQYNSFECGLNVLIISKIILYGNCLNESRHRLTFPNAIHYC